MLAQFLVQEWPPIRHIPPPLPSSSCTSFFSAGPFSPKLLQTCRKPYHAFQETAKQQLMGWTFISFPLPMTYIALKQLPKGMPVF